MGDDGHKLFRGNDRTLEEPLPPIALLVQTVNRGRYYDFIWEPANRETFGREDIDDFMAADTRPLPSAQDRFNYFKDRDVEYWVSGLTDHLKAMAIYERHGEKSGPEQVLDFGGASGRVLRHYAYRTGARLFGADVD